MVPDFQRGRLESQPMAIIRNHTMKAFMSFSLGASVLLLRLACHATPVAGEPAVAAGRSSTYRHPQLGFSLTLPAGWEIMRENVLGAAVFFVRHPESWPTPWVDIGNVRIVERDRYPTLDAFISSSIRDSEANPDFRLLSQGEVNGSRWIIYTTTGRTAPGNPLLTTQAYQYFRMEKRGFVAITCSSLPESFDRVKDAFESICRSFQWEKPDEGVDGSMTPRTQP